MNKTIRCAIHLDETCDLDCPMPPAHRPGCVCTAQPAPDAPTSAEIAAMAERKMAEAAKEAAYDARMSRITAAVNAHVPAQPAEVPLHLASVTPTRDFNLTRPEDFKWLADFFGGFHGVGGLQARLAAMEAQPAPDALRVAARAALDFYANPANYEPGGNPPTPNVLWDNGRLARAALGDEP